MTERLANLAFNAIALALASAPPVGAQTALEIAMNKQLAWCAEQSDLMVVRGHRESVDLEPHHAAVLAACADVETNAVNLLSNLSTSGFPWLAAETGVGSADITDSLLV